MSVVSTITDIHMRDVCILSIGKKYTKSFLNKNNSRNGSNVFWQDNRDLTILGRQRDHDGQNKLLQINGSKDNLSYIINRMDLIQF
jgi:hypothetical protein